MMNQSSGVLYKIYANDFKFSRMSQFTPALSKSFCERMMYYFGGGGTIGFFGSGWMKGGGSGIVTCSTSLFCTIPRKASGVATTTGSGISLHMPPGWFKLTLAFALIFASFLSLNKSFFELINKR